MQDHICLKFNVLKLIVYLVKYAMVLIVFEIFRKKTVGAAALLKLTTRMAKNYYLARGRTFFKKIFCFILYYWEYSGLRLNHLVT